MSIGDLPESSSQAMLVGTMLVGRLSVIMKTGWSQEDGHPYYSMARIRLLSDIKYIYIYITIIIIYDNIYIYICIRIYIYIYIYIYIALSKHLNTTIPGVPFLW